LASLFIASVTAASLTTGEKVILMAAGSLSVDVYQHSTNASDAKTLFVTKLTTVFIIVVAVIITILKPDAVLALAMFAWSAIASTILVPYVFGLFWKRGTTAGAISAGLAALIVTIVWWLCFKSASLNASLNTDIFPLLGDLGKTVLYDSPKIKITVASIHEFITSQVAAVIVFIIVSMLTKPRNPEKVDEIFTIMLEKDSE
jgi:Na+(H+)/acetate symporter ActP